MRWLRKELDRCLMDRAFRTLHETIEERDTKITNLRKQITNLETARDKVLMNTQQQTIAAKAAAKDGRVARSEYDRQLGINRVLKAKNHIRIERYKALVKQLRDFVDASIFQKICADLDGRPDSDFVPTPGSKAASADDDAQEVKP